jgi:hypothetical protein
MEVQLQSASIVACAFMSLFKGGAGALSCHTTYAVGLVCYTTLPVAQAAGLATEASNEDCTEKEEGGFAKRAKPPSSFW